MAKREFLESAVRCCGDGWCSHTDAHHAPTVEMRPAHDGEDGFRIVAFGDTLGIVDVITVA